MTQPQNGSGLSVVKLRLAALLCGSRMEQRKGLCDRKGVAVRLSQLRSKFMELEHRHSFALAARAWQGRFG